MDIKELQDFFDQSKDVIAIVDQELRYEAVNSEYCRYWGFSREEVLGAEMVSIVGTSTFHDSIRDLMYRCLEGKSLKFERWLDYPGVGLRHMDVRFSPRRDASGSVTGVFLISRDTTDRMKLQARIKGERDKFDQILSSLDVGLVLYNEDLTIEWVNEKLKEQFPGADPQGKYCYDFFKGRTVSCENCPTLDTLRTGEVCGAEVVQDDGRIFSLVSVPLKNEMGNISQALARVVDITEQKKALEDLKAREAELSSIFRATQVAIGLVKDRIFVTGNDCFFEMLGYSREELLGASTRIVYKSDEDYAYAGTVAYGGMEGDKTTSVETQWMRKDGNVLDVLVTTTSLIPGDPSAGVTFAGMDITERKQAQKAISESEQRFRRIFENVDMIAVQGYDEDRRVIYWNPASEKLYGYTREEAMGNLLELLIIPYPMREAVIEAHGAWVNEGKAIPAGELELLHKNGNLVPVYSSHVMQETSQGQKYMFCVDVDLAEIKRIHSHLVRAKEEAEAANMAKSEFLANMSHEIRTPLNGIQGMLSLIHSSPKDEAQKEYAQAGVESAMRLNRLLSDILDLSRVEAGKMTIEKDVFNLPYLVRQLRDLFKFSFDEADISLECHCDPDVPENVVGDSARLQQVLTNIIGNGLKYTDKGEVRLNVSRLPSLHEGRHRIYFTVSDTGVGISPDVLSSLFEPFTQGSQGYTRQHQGAGLGLSICKRLVRLMGGNMSVESEHGKGSTVHLVIPFDEGISVPVSATVEINEEGGTGRPVQLNVLLAEDDRINSMVAQRMLERAGCSVDVVTSGAKSIEMLAAGEYMAVFMDVQMPHMDGLEATRAIRDGQAGEKNRNIPIFALTAYTMAGDREKILTAGMDDYIPKPVEMDDIQRALRIAIKKRFADGS